MSELLDRLNGALTWAVLEVDTSKEPSAETYINKIEQELTEKDYELTNVFQNQKIPDVYHLHITKIKN